MMQALGKEHFGQRIVKIVKRRVVSASISKVDAFHGLASIKLVERHVVLV